MGRAGAVAVATGRRVALSGRRREPLQETAEMVEEAGGEALVLPVDARDREAITQAHATIQASWGGVDDVVLAAGLNRATLARHSIRWAELPGRSGVLATQGPEFLG